MSERLMLTTTEPSMHGRALGLLEFAIGIMPIATLGLGACAERFGIDRTTFVSALALVAIMIILAAWTRSWSGTAVAVRLSLVRWWCLLMRGATVAPPLLRRAGSGM